MKKNGFTLIEIMIVVAIIGILATIATLSLGNRSSKNAAMEVKTRVPILISNAVGRSFDNGESIRIRFDLSNYKIEVRKVNGNTLIDSIKLPQTLNYQMVDDSGGASGVTEVVLNDRGSCGSAAGINLKVTEKNNNFVLRVRIRDIAGTAIVEVYTNGFNSTPTSRM